MQRKRCRCKLCTTFSLSLACSRISTPVSFGLLLDGYFLPQRRGICINIHPQNLANESVTQQHCLCGKVEARIQFFSPLGVSVTAPTSSPFCREWQASSCNCNRCCLYMLGYDLGQHKQIISVARQYPVISPRTIVCKCT